MEASIVDLRYKMNDVLKALDRKEEVTVLYRGTVKGKIIPVAKKTSETFNLILFLVWPPQQPTPCLKN